MYNVGVHAPPIPGSSYSDAEIGVAPNQVTVGDGQSDGRFGYRILTSRRSSVISAVFTRELLAANLHVDNQPEAAHR